MFDALQKVRALGEDGTLATFVGESAEAYREKFEKVPPNLEKLHTSYDLAGQALLSYAPKLEDAQRDADQALTDVEDARAEPATAQSWLERATSALEDAEEEAEPPDEEEVSAEVRRALSDAQLDAGNAQSAVDDAREKLNAAIALAQQAKEAREEAAERCKRDLEEASDGGMQNKKRWQKSGDQWSSGDQFSAALVEVGDQAMVSEPAHVVLQVLHRFDGPGGLDLPCERQGAYPGGVGGFEIATLEM